VAATTAGALKALLEAQGLGISFYRDQAPDTTPPVKLPYGTIEDGVSVLAEQSGDFGAGGTLYGTEFARVHIWQEFEDTSTNPPTRKDSYTLVPAVRRAVHGAVLSAAPTKVYGCRMAGHTRLLESQNNRVHDVVTVEIRRVL